MKIKIKIKILMIRKMKNQLQSKVKLIKVIYNIIIKIIKKI